MESENCDLCKKENKKCIFHCEKNEENGWYKKNSDGIKKWKEKKVKEFWEEIRNKKMKNKNYDFSYFVFPEFEEVNYEDVGVSNNSTKEIGVHKINKKKIFGKREMI